MANLFKRISRCVPAYAEALGVRSLDEMQFLIEEDGQLVFRPPSPDVLSQMIAEARRKQAAEQRSILEPEPESEPMTVETPKVSSSSPVEIPKIEQPKVLPVVSGPQANAVHGPAQVPVTVPPKGRSGIQVDLDARPNWQHNLTVRWHRPGGRFYWDPSRVTLFRSPRQFGAGINGTALRGELTSRNPFNVNLLNWLIHHQQEIPFDWRRNGRKIFFWDTIFEDRHGNGCVMFIALSHHRWVIGIQLMAASYTSNDYAACRC